MSELYTTSDFKKMEEMIQEIDDPIIDGKEYSIKYDDRDIEIIVKDGTMSITFDAPHWMQKEWGWIGAGFLTKQEMEQIEKDIREG